MTACNVARLQENEKHLLYVKLLNWHKGDKKLCT